jgi:hypothetical protein
MRKEGLRQLKISKNPTWNQTRDLTRLKLDGTRNNHRASRGGKKSVNFRDSRPHTCSDKCDKISIVPPLNRQFQFLFQHSN